MKTLALAFPQGAAFADALAAALPLDVAPVAWRRFPDGESLVRIEPDCSGRSVAVVASLHDPDRVALPLRFAARTARELGAVRVGLVAPYLAYMRQDARFHPGEAVSSRLFAEFLGECFDWLVTVDPHLHRHGALEQLFRVPVRAASAMPAIADWIASNVQDPVLIGPDSESAQWVESVAGLLGAPWAVLDKVRHGDRDVEVSRLDPAVVRGRRPVVVDDMVSSGRTLIETLGRIRELGLPAATCVTVHGVFADGADRALLAAGAARVVTCNTVEHATNAIDVSPAVAAALRTLGA